MCVFADKTHSFKITPQTEILWYESAQGHSLCLKRTSDDEELLCQRNSYTNFNMKARRFSVDELATLNGEIVYVTFADESTKAWGHIQLDNLKVTNALFGKYYNVT